MSLTSWSVAHTRTGRLICLVLVVAESAAVATAGVIICVNLVRGRAVPGVAPLVIVAGPLVFVGQIWMLALGWSRMRPGVRPRAIGDLAEMWRLVSGELNRAVGVVLLVLFFGGVLTAMVASSSIGRGGPTAGSADCPYRLESHGTYTCVSKVEYDRAGAALQRFAGGILLGFFSLHLGAALGGLAGQEAGRRARSVPGGPGNQGE